MAKYCLYVGEGFGGAQSGALSKQSINKILLKLSWFYSKYIISDFSTIYVFHDVHNKILTNLYPMPFFLFTMAFQRTYLVLKWSPTYFSKTKG